MNLLNNSVELIEQKPGITGINEIIEIAGRTCYKSNDLIKEGSAEKFVNRMISLNHNAMLEHGTVYLQIKATYFNILDRYCQNKYTVVKFDDEEGVEFAYITTNLRVIIENDWLEDLQYLVEPTVNHEKRYTIRFHTQIAITREMNRHKHICAAN